MIKKEISVIGLGYIGLPTAALLCNNGYKVNGIDINHEVVNTVNNGSIHILEPGLDEIVSEQVSSGRLKAFTEPQKADIYIICVPTPLNNDNDKQEPNIKFVLEAAENISTFLKAGDILILESTSPVGTTQHIADTLFNKGVNLNDIHICYCPERVLPGKIIKELVENDRIIGGLTPESSRQAGDFYRTFIRGQVFETDAKTAEMCKLTENCFRDLNIAFANELSIICDSEGINVWELISLANHHPRVNILQPGIGVGGHCIAIDPWFVVSRHEQRAKCIKAARETNLQKTDHVIHKIVLEAERIERKIGTMPKIACFGLAFKPNIDDLRESPAVNITKNLISKGYRVMAVEPNLKVHKSFNLFTISEALTEPDLVVILVKHDQFLKSEVKEKIKQFPYLDFCGGLC